LCEGAPRQKAAESRKIPESGSVIPREGVESFYNKPHLTQLSFGHVIPREGVESYEVGDAEREIIERGDPERGS
jgi:hypothetical protein